VDETKSFWSWRGQYIGYRTADGLFGPDGRQIGYFAEGDEVYACTGDYLGEVRGNSRLITNISKKAWTRRPIAARLFRSYPEHQNVDAKEMLVGFKDFPTPSGSV
jgi:hypothetical protein